MEDFMSDESLEEELFLFLYLCGEDDKKFMSVSPERRKTEDYVRLIALAAVFGFRRVILRVAQEAEDCGVDVFPAVEGLNGDLPRVRGWVDAFITGVQDEKVRALMREEWQKKLSAIEPQHFQISQLL